MPAALGDSLRASARAALSPRIVGWAGTRAMTPVTDLRPGEYVRSDTASVSIRRGGTLQQVLPVRFFGPDASGARLLKLAPVVVIEQGALRMRPDGTQYDSGVLVGVRDELNPNERIALPAETVFQLSVSGGTVEPSELELRHTNPPFERVTVSSGAPPDTLALRIGMSFAGTDLVASIPVERPRVIVQAPAQLPGWGVGRGSLTIRISEDAGQRSRAVILTPSSGSLDSQIVHVTPDEPRQVGFRTEGLRTVTIAASSAGLTDGVAVIKLASPAGFFLAAFIGGLIGALIKALFSKRRAARTLMRHAIGGVLMGVVAAAAYLFDVNLTQISVKAGYNEIVVSLIAAAGSIGVLAILSMLSGNVRQALEGGRS